MKFAIGKMTIGDILDRSVKLLTARFRTIYTINFIAYLPILAFGLTSPQIMKTFGLAGYFGAISTLAIANLFLASLATGATLLVVSREFADVPVSFGEAMGFALGRLGPLIVTGFLFGLVMSFGCMCCIAPGIIFLGWYGVCYPVTVLEKKMGVAAMSRSKELLKGNEGRMIGLFLLVYYAIPMGLGSGIGLITAFLLPPYEQVPFRVDPNNPLDIRGMIGPINWMNLIIGEVLKFFVTMLTASYANTAIALFYFDLRIRKEGYDLELAAGRTDDDTPEFDMES